MLSTASDGLHGSFLSTNEFGQGLFAVTTSGLTIVQLASVPLGTGSIPPALGTHSGGATPAIRSSGFQSATKATFGGKQAPTTFEDVNALSIVTPVRSPGPQQLLLTNPHVGTVPGTPPSSLNEFSPNQSGACFILVCENFTREGQCTHENLGTPI